MLILCKVIGIRMNKDHYWCRIYHARVSVYISAGLWWLAAQRSVVYARGSIAEPRWLRPNLVCKSRELPEQDQWLVIRDSMQGTYPSMQEVLSMQVVLMQVVLSCKRFYPSMQGVLSLEWISVMQEYLSCKWFYVHLSHARVSVISCKGFCHARGALRKVSTAAVTRLRCWYYARL